MIYPFVLGLRRCVVVVSGIKQTHRAVDGVLLTDPRFV
jgi:hypothetical protein